MYRLFPALLAFLVLTLFAVTATQAAEPVSDFLMLAQIPHMTRGPGMYLNLFKFVPVVIIYILWAWTTNWVEHDTKELINLRFAVWNSAVFFSGVLGLALVLAIPIYFIGLGLLLLAYFVPLMSYIYARNQTVPDDQKVLTPYHLGEVCNDILHKLGMKALFNKDVGTVDRSGPPIVFVGKTQGSAKEDPTRVRQAEESRSYMAAKELVYDAVLRRSTDIHLEPTTEQLSVRYRIDGILHAAEPFDRPTGDAVVNVFKVLSAMDISEKRKPQDGSFVTLAGRSLDFRVATSGSKAGEKLVMRILDNSSSVTKMEDLGMRPKLIEQVRGLVTQPHGMFLCCGPTGAGKSTTLYAALREIDRYQKNIITVEDPIEYQLDNVTQMEVNTKAGQTFATSLRSILRQDPDVIMIGEIRDQETASIACQAANTGHMVFSTVHSNDAVTALFRLLDLGVEPFMIASALSGVLGQRLVRLLCEACKEPYKPKPEFLKKANLPADKVDVFYRRPENPEEVCQQCGGTGYFGRTGIYELLVLTEAMREMIRENPSINKIKAEARKAGMIYLQEDGLRQVIQGRTSIEELLRELSNNEPHDNRANSKVDQDRVFSTSAIQRSDPTSEVIRMKLLIDFIILFLALGMAYALVSEGLWGAALMFFNVLFAAMIAFNFYEPLARLLDSTGINWGFSDTLCMLGLFCVALVVLRMTTETIAPAMVRFPMPVYHAGRIIFGLAGGAVTTAVIVLAFHAAPVHKKIFNAVDYKSKPPFGLGLDHLWLGFFQYETGAVFSNTGYGRPDPYRTYGQGGRVNVFDPRAVWLLDHYDARPYGTGSSVSGGGEDTPEAPPPTTPGGGGGGRAGGRGGGAAPP